MGITKRVMNTDKRIRIAHIINPVKVNQNSDLYDAQPITFESMGRARDYAKSRDINLDVNLIAVFYPEDESIVPDYFNEKIILKKSVLDFGEFEVEKKLPVISEIIHAGNSTGNYDYVIYTNVDIAVQPFFYEYIYQKICNGYEGLIINRRTISKQPGDINNLVNMYSEVGEQHPGYDCFILNCKHISEMEWGNACIGANWIGRILFANTIGWSEKFEIIEDAHITFHLGDDRSWKSNKISDYEKHNTKEVVSALDKLKAKSGFNFIPLLGKYQEQLKGILTTQGKEYVRIEEPGDNIEISEDPVFIVGYPRSGTTLIQSFLSGHTNLVSFPETHFFNIVWSRALPKPGEKLTESQVLTAIDVFKQFAGFEVYGELKNKLLQKAEMVEMTHRDLFEIIIKGLLAHLYPGINGTIRILEKTPSHARAAGRIRAIYPKSKFIWVIRRPLDSIISAKKHLEPQNRMTPEEIAKDWVGLNNAMDAFKSKFSNQVYQLAYNDFCSKPEYFGKSIADFIGLGFNQDADNSNSKNIIMPWETWKKSNYKKIEKAKKHYLYFGSLIKTMKIHRIISKEKRF
jgi:hypothetical protein